MNYSIIQQGQCIIRYAVYSTNADNGEMHAIVRFNNNVYKSFTQQKDEMLAALNHFISEKSKENYTPLMMRILLSDASNQAADVTTTLSNTYPSCAVAYVQQPPLDGSKMAIAVYMMQNTKVKRIDNVTIEAERNGYHHYLSANICNPLANTLEETYTQLNYLETILANEGMTIEDNCVRTWFYVQNIDVNYHDVVVARRNNFNEHNLTVNTHYIASTGIGGRYASKEVTSILDAYSIKGIKDGQIKYLYAENNMNRTSDYGVTFERGTIVDYADRREIYVSGTASIDNKGNVVAMGDIVAQTNRMIDNVKALFDEAGADLSTDIAHIVVYLRDTADYHIVEKMMSERFTNVPMVITWAPVCRPGWLIEMECMGITSI